MPEGPEVTITSQYLASKLRNKTISNLEILSGLYTKHPLEGKNLFDAEKYTVLNVDSKGKLIWFILENIRTKNIIYMISHLGLTGEWSFYEDKNDRIKFKVSDNNKIYTLYYSDDRNFGSIMITEDKQILKDKQNKLAPDLLKTDFDDETFIEWIDNFKNKSKARFNMILGKILMNQDLKNGIGSGIGNYLGCEILYRAKLSPHRTIGSLNKKEILNLGYWIKYTMKLAYFHNSIEYISNISENYINLHREGILNGKYPDYHPDIKFKNETFEFLVYRRDIDNFGNPIVADKNINKPRTTYWCPKIQK